MSDSTKQLEDFLGKRRVEEKLLLTLGQLPKYTADTLMGYAYMPKSTVNVRLTLDRDINNEFKNPTFIYDIEIKEKLRYMVAQWGLRHGVFGKILTLLMIRMGAPMTLAEHVRWLASNLLVPPYQVKVNVHPFPLKQLPLPPGLQKVEVGNE